MPTEDPYTEPGAETPLERAARAEAASQAPTGQESRAEREADVVVGDVDRYVAETDPASLPQAEAALNAWQIPSSPLEGVPGDVALHPGHDGESLVSVFSAGSESEANIVRGLLEAEGIAVILREVAMPSYGSVLSVSEARWADLLVNESQAQQARDAIETALQSSADDAYAQDDESEADVANKPPA